MTTVDPSIVLDSFGVLYTEAAQDILAETVLMITKPDPVLIGRLLTHIVGNKKPPSKVRFLVGKHQSCPKQWKDPRLSWNYNIKIVRF
jgi:hypothetical protein